MHSLEGLRLASEEESKRQRKIRADRARYAKSLAKAIAKYGPRVDDIPYDPQGLLSRR